MPYIMCCTGLKCMSIMRFAMPSILPAMQCHCRVAFTRIPLGMCALKIGSNSTVGMCARCFCGRCRSRHAPPCNTHLVSLGFLVPSLRTRLASCAADAHVQRQVSPPLRWAPTALCIDAGPPSPLPTGGGGCCVQGLLGGRWQGVRPSTWTRAASCTLPFSLSTWTDPHRSMHVAEHVTTHLARAMARRRARW